MPFFKKRVPDMSEYLKPSLFNGGAEAGMFGMPGQSLHDPRLQAQHMPPFQQPQQAQHQASLEQHRIAELQDLHMRMQKLQLQMDQLTTSVQERRASAPPNAQETAPPSVPGMPGMPDIQGLSSSLPKAAGHFGSPSASMHGGTDPSASTDPGPCPFPAYPNMPRFEELDDNEASGTGGPPVGTGRRASTTSSLPADAREEQIELERLIREGKAARARSTTPSMGQHNSPKTSSQAHPSFMHSNPASGLGRPSIPHGTTAPASGYMSREITPGIDSVPRRASMHVWPPSMPGMPAPGMDANGMAMPRMSAFGSERAPMQGVPMAPSSTNTGIPSVHGMPAQPMQAQGHASPFPTNQQAQPGFGTSAGTTASGGYQFPNPFNLEHGPHVPGFGNGFTLQQMPSLMGQIGAHFQMPRGMQYGMTKSASPRPHYGF